MITEHAQVFKKFPAWIYKTLAQTWIDYKFPRHIFIETTASCNLACPYCPREKIRQDMDFELFKQIVDEASKFGSRSFSLHLFGEPLLYPRIFEAVTYIKGKNPRHTVLLTTNGTKINGCVDEIVQSKIDLILWTWRPEAKFTDSTRAMLKRWGRFRVRFINEITTKEGYAQWQDWKNVEGRRLHNYGGEINIEKFQKMTFGIMSFHQPELKDILNQNQTRKLKEDSKLQKKNMERWPCYHLFLSPAIAWNGNILLCCADPHQKEVIGHFPETSLSAAWRGGRLAKIRNAHILGRYEGICKDCDVWKEYPDLFFKWQKR